MSGEKFSFKVPVDGIGAKAEPADDGSMNVSLRLALIEAATCVNATRQSFDTASDIDVGQWPDHPDLEAVKAWLKGREGEAHHRDTHHREAHQLEVIYWLAVHVRSAWQELPKMTTTEHRKLYARIQELCRGLEEALEETGSAYYRGGGNGLRSASVADLLTDQEHQALNGALSASGGLANWEHRWAFPRFEELLERIAQAAKRLGDAGPLHTQPGKRGAERGFFVRKMAGFMRSHYGECPHEVLAAITSVALGEPTDRELVAKLLT